MSGVHNGVNDNRHTKTGDFGSNTVDNDPQYHAEFGTGQSYLVEEQRNHLPNTNYHALQQPVPQDRFSGGNFSLKHADCSKNGGQISYGGQISFGTAFSIAAREAAAKLSCGAIHPEANKWWKGFFCVTLIGPLVVGILAGFAGLYGGFTRRSRQVLPDNNLPRHPQPSSTTKLNQSSTTKLNRVNHEPSSSQRLGAAQDRLRLLHDQHQALVDDRNKKGQSDPYWIERETLNAEIVNKLKKSNFEKNPTRFEEELNQDFARYDNLLAQGRTWRPTLEDFAEQTRKHEGLKLPQDPLCVQRRDLIRQINQDICDKKLAQVQQGMQTLRTLLDESPNAADAAIVTQRQLNELNQQITDLDEREFQDPFCKERGVLFAEISSIDRADDAETFDQSVAQARKLIASGQQWHDHETEMRPLITQHEELSARDPKDPLYKAREKLIAKYDNRLSAAKFAEAQRLITEFQNYIDRGRKYHTYRQQWNDLQASHNDLPQNNGDPRRERRLELLQTARRAIDECEFDEKFAQTLEDTHEQIALGQRFERLNHELEERKKSDQLVSRRSNPAPNMKRRADLMGTIKTNLVSYRFDAAEKQLAELAGETHSTKLFHQYQQQLSKYIAEHQKLGKDDEYARLGQDPFYYDRENTIEQIQDWLSEFTIDGEMDTCFKELVQHLHNGRKWYTLELKLEQLTKQHNQLHQRLKQQDSNFNRRFQLIQKITQDLTGGKLSNAEWAFLSLEQALNNAQKALAAAEQNQRAGQPPLQQIALPLIPQGKHDVDKVEQEAQARKELENARRENQWLCNMLKEHSDPSRTTRQDSLIAVDKEISTGNFAAAGKLQHALHDAIISAKKEFFMAKLLERERADRATGVELGRQERRKLAYDIRIALYNNNFDVVLQGLEKYKKLNKIAENQEAHLGRLAANREAHSRLIQYDGRYNEKGTRERSELLQAMSKSIQQNDYDSAWKIHEELEQLIAKAEERTPYWRNYAQRLNQHLALVGEGHSAERQALLNQLNAAILNGKFKAIPDLEQKLDQNIKVGTGLAEINSVATGLTYSRTIESYAKKANALGTAFTTRLAVSVANSIFESDEVATVCELIAFRDALKEHRLAKSYYGRLMLRRVDELIKNGSLLATLNSIGTPDPKNAMCDYIRTVCELPLGEKVTAKHARTATLAALLTELRQGNAGSCFGTATAIHIHEDLPLQFLENMKEMIETGYLSQQSDGVSKTIERVAVQKGNSTQDFDAAVTLDLKTYRETTNLQGRELIKKSFEPHWHRMPDLSFTLEMMKIPYTFLADAVAACAEGAAEDDAVYLTKDQILRKVIQQNYGNLTDQQVGLPSRIRRLESRSKYLETVYGMNFRNVRDVETLPSPRAKEDYQELTRVRMELKQAKHEFSQIEQRLSQYQRALQRAQDFMIGYYNNPLLRSFEYTISAFSETGPYAQLLSSTKKDFTAGLMKNVKEHALVSLRKTAAFAEAEQTLGPHIGSLDKALEKALGELVNQNLRLEYDANIQQYNSASGGYHKGGFRLVNTHGQRSAQHWTAIHDAEAYDQMVVDLLNAAVDKATEMITDKNVLDKVSVVKTNLCQWAAAAAKDKQQHARPTGWEFRQGNFGLTVLRNYYNEDLGVLRLDCKTGDDVMRLLVAAYQDDARYAETDGYLLNTLGCRPGHDFRMIIPRGTIAQAFFDEVLKNGQLPLSTLAKNANLPKNSVIVFGDSNHGYGDRHKFYGLQYDGEHFQLVHSYRLFGHKNGSAVVPEKVAVEKASNLTGNWYIYNNSKRELLQKQ